MRDNWRLFVGSAVLAVSLGLGGCVVAAGVDKLDECGACRTASASAGSTSAGAADVASSGTSGATSGATTADGASAPASSTSGTTTSSTAAQGGDEAGGAAELLNPLLAYAAGLALLGALLTIGGRQAGSSPASLTADPGAFVDRAEAAAVKANEAATAARDVSPQEPPRSLAHQVQKAGSSAALAAEALAFAVAQRVGALTDRQLRARRSTIASTFAAAGNAQAAAHQLEGPGGNRQHALDTARAAADAARAAARQCRTLMEIDD